MRGNHDAVHQRVASMTLLAPGGYGEEFNHPLLMKWASASTAAELGRVLPHFFGENYSMPEKIVDFQMDVRGQPGAIDSLVQIVTAMSKDGKQGVLPIDEVIGTRIPISVVWGREDRILPVSQGEAMVGKVDLHVLDGVGHSPAEEAADLVRDLILQKVQNV